MKIIELTGTCSAGGALTVTASKNVIGYVEKVVMDYADGATGADLTLTNESSVSETILVKTDLGVADVVFYPRSLGNKSTDGTAFTNVAEKIFVTGAFKLVIAQGGVSKNFRFLVYVSDE